MRVVEIQSVLLKILLHFRQGLPCNGLVAFPFAAPVFHASEKAKGGQRVAEHLRARQTEELSPHVDIRRHADRRLGPSLGLVVQ